MLPTIPDDWKPALRAYLKDKSGEDRDRLSAYDFPSGQTVAIRFPDESSVHFRHAFAIADEDRGMVAVFTEHCGYHVFPLIDARLKIVESPQISASTTQVGDGVYSIGDTTLWITDGAIHMKARTEFDNPTELNSTEARELGQTLINFALRLDDAEPWSVWRIDDTGNTFLVRENLLHEDADKLAAELTARGHKQMYWVERGRPATNP